MIKLILAENIRGGGKTNSCILLPPTLPLPPVKYPGRSFASGSVNGWIVVTYLEAQILKGEIGLNWLFQRPAAFMTIMNV